MAIRIRFVNPDEKKPSAPKKQSAAERKEAAFKQLADEPEQEPAAHVAPTHTERAPVHLTENDGSHDLAWLKPLGWRANPFRDTTPLPPREFFVGRTEARSALGVLLRREGHFGIIEGPRGSGTTFLLSWLAEELEAHERIFRIVHERMPLEPEQFTKLLVEPYQGLFSSYKGTTPQELVAYVSKRERKTLAILIDDADTLGPIEPILRAFIEHSKAVIVLAGRGPLRLREPNVLLTLGELDSSAAIELVRRRIEAVGGNGTHPLSHDQLTSLWHDSMGDLHLYLSECEIAAKEAKHAVHSQTEAALHESSTSIASEAAEQEPAPEKPAAAGNADTKRTRIDSLLEGLDDAPVETKKKGR